MSYASAKAIDPNSIPVIDMGLLAEGDRAAVETVGQALVDAAQSVGFFYVRNHGVPQQLIDRAFALSRRFFALPEEIKQRVRINAIHRGFLAVGGARMYETARVDLKESFIWGPELGLDDPDVAAGKPLMGPNQWPAELPELAPGLGDYLGAVMGCARSLLRGFAVSLGLDADFFRERFAKPLARCSLIYYPPQPPDSGSDQFGVAPHTDYGGLTLLNQDDTRGLQVRARSGEWVTAVPIPGTFVVNIGDLMARWTNDRFVSTPHRVVNSSGRARYSMALFFDPAFDTVIDPRDLRPDGTALYPPVTCGEYIVSRFNKAFTYRQPSHAAR
ncbi:MAG TPA: 2-oxoglutarate and iron-dependent oxygenase domain-containing protein [Stellaceae bacterium]|nr:2-oxoglutarate and iron-dependent oxygenase domain-containing protein [Stellaceae bacterium]